MLKAHRALILVGALGYFVDVYDLVLFGIVRVSSLRSLGFKDSDLFSAGVKLLNFQMAGVLLGGFVWGLLADRYGRARVLFASIFVYSAANIANAFVTDVHAYELLRFVAGFGLAGELGIAVTLVSEILPRQTRGWGAVIIGFAGFSGAICAALVGGEVNWRTAYLCGGGLGLALLFARLGVRESPLFAVLHARPRAKRRWYFISGAGARKYARCFFVGVPIWFISGLLMYFAPEFARALSVAGPVTAANAILWSYGGSLPGDVLSGYLSQRLRSRKLVIRGLLILGAFVMAAFFWAPKNSSPLYFYALCFLLGIVNGYWTLFVAMTAEQFGTDVRATATTSIPNLVRASVIPITLLFQWLAQSAGVLGAGAVMGLTCVALSLINLSGLRETFGIDLDYSEARA